MQIRPPVDSGVSLAHDGAASTTKRFDAAWTPVLLGLLGYGLYASFFDAWPMGWLNLAQQSVFGSYSTKVSMLLFFVLAMMVGVMALAALEKLFGTTGPGVAPAPAASVARATRPDSQARLMLKVCAGFVGVLWLGGFAVSAWFEHQQRSDNSAEYPALRLDDIAASNTAAGDHFSLQGQVLESRAVVKHTGNESSGYDNHWLLPLVPADWHEGQPARLVLQVSNPAQLPGHSPMNRGRAWLLREPLLVRVGDAVSVPAASEFGKIGVPLAPGHRVLHLIPSRDGKPIPADIDYLQRMWWICGLGTGLLLLALGPAAWVVHRRERRTG